jgi:hypothetical protein
LDGVITSKGWFHITPLVFKSNGPYDRFNKYYYRDATVHSLYNGNFKQKKLADYYFFNKGKDGRIIEWEDTQIEGYIGFWPWKKLIECDEPAHTYMTQVFYVNMKLIDNLWGFLTFVVGQPILVTIL